MIEKYLDNNFIWEYTMKYSRRQRIAARRRRALSPYPRPAPPVRAKRKASHLLDLIIMPYFYVTDEFIKTLRDIFNVS